MKKKKRYPLTAPSEPCTYLIMISPNRYSEKFPTAQAHTNTQSTYTPTGQHQGFPPSLTSAHHLHRHCGLQGCRSLVANLRDKAKTAKILINGFPNLVNSTTGPSLQSKTTINRSVCSINGFTIYGDVLTSRSPTALD